MSEEKQMLDITESRVRKHSALMLPLPPAMPMADSTNQSRHHLAELAGSLTLFRGILGGGERLFWTLLRIAKAH